MTSLIHSSITEPNDRKNSLNSTDTSRSFLPNDSSFSSSRFKRKKPSAIIDQILHADKSGFLPSDSFLSSQSLSTNLDLSNTLSSFDRSVLDSQLKRTISYNEALEASIKRVRTEAQHSLKGLINQNESLELSLRESQMKISELEDLLNKSRQSKMNSIESMKPISFYEEQVKTLQKEKNALKLQLDETQSLHSKDLSKLEQNINDLKHQLIDTDNKFKLSKFVQEQAHSINQHNINQINEKNQQIDELQKRIIELELVLSTMHSTNVLNQSLENDVKRMNDIRFENEQLKKEIELLKLKYNERIVSNEEIRMLRKQVDTSNDYRILIAKQQVEIAKLRQQLANDHKTNVI